MPTTAEFFEKVLGTTETGYVELKTDNFETSRWFEWPEDRRFLASYTDMRRSEDVWFSAMLFNQKDRHSENSTVTQAVYMDADECHPSRFRVKPSYSIQTSEGHWQCFWLLDQPYPAADVSNVGHKIAVAHKPDGCDQSGWISSKMMRVPGTTNTKYDIPYRVRFSDEHSSLAVHTLEDLDNAYDDINVERAIEVNSAVPKRLPKVTEALENFPPELWHLYEDDVPEGGSWSSRMWALLMGLFQTGYTPEEAFVVAKNARCNKYLPEHAGKLTQQGVPIPERSDPEGTTWNEVLKAHRAYLEGEEVPKVPTVAESEIVEREVKHRVRVKPSFLTDDERDMVASERTFIDDYTEWVRSKSDSAEKFQRTLAYLLLSCVYGNLAYINPQFGRMDLNLYVMILGPSTFGRKSTARSMFLRMLHEFERVTSTRIDIGSDFTGEGLNRELSERPDMVSLVHRDEFQGFIHEIYNKTYLTGVTEKLTEMYDGRVHNTLRSRSDASLRDRIHVIFSMLGLGIADEVAEALTDKSFKSGFLARFVWAVIDDIGEITPEMVLVGQQETDYDSVSRDEFIDDTIDYFQDRMIALNSGSGTRKKMLMNNLAFERYSEWVLQISGLTDDDMFKSPSDSMIPSVERLRYSVWKAAALLAVHEGTDKIEYHHVVHALAQAELWYEDMAYMASMISTSEFERDVAKVEAFMASSPNGRRTKASVYAKFAATRPNTVQEWIESLLRAGVIQDERTHYRYAPHGGSDD